MAKKTKTQVSKTKKKTVVKKTAKAPVTKKVAKKTTGKTVIKKTTKVVSKKVGKSAAKKKTTSKSKVVLKKSQSGGNTSRYFKVKYDNNSPTGRFSGSKPKQAANKALTSILKLREGAGQSTTIKIRFSIVECTRGSKHKEYSYVGERVELEKPMEVKIGKGPNAKTIKYRYNNKVFKDKVLKK
jgi:hypothetical protein